jgi:membrane-bound ClpP family serine protease
VKLIFGLIGAAMMVAFLASFALKVMEPSMMVVIVIGLVMMVADLWQARDEADT